MGAITRILLSTADGLARYLSAQVLASDVISITDDITGNPPILGGGIKVGDATNNTQFEADGTVKLNGSATGFDDMLFEIQYQDSNSRPSSGVAGPACSSVKGSFQNLYRRNGLLWELTEGGTAGKLCEITFQNVRQVPILFFTGIYNGTTAHAANLTWQAYNYVTTVWDTLTFTWVNATQYTDAPVVAGFTSQHISASGEVKVGVNHASVVVAGHTLALDEVYLVEDNQPSSIPFHGGRIQSFRNTGFDAFHGKVQFRHAYKVASNFTWHVHFTNHEGTIEDGQTVVFTLSKSFAAINNLFPTESTLTATFTNNAAWRASLTTQQAASIIVYGTAVAIGSHIIAAGATSISGTNLNISAIGMLEIIRSVGTHVGNIGILYSDFHIEQDTLASRTEFTK